MLLAVFFKKVKKQPLLLSFSKHCSIAPTSGQFCTAASERDPESHSAYINPKRFKMAAKGVIVIDQGVHATYVVTSTFDYYVQLAAGSKITFKSKSGGPITVTKNIWGPGSVDIACNATMAAPMGQAPSQAAINGLQVFQYQLQNTKQFTEIIP